MFKCSFLIFTLLHLKVCTSFAQNQIVGKWLTENKKAIVQIYEQKGKYYGKIVWLQTPKDKKGNPVKDKYNPKPALRSKTIMGLVVLNAFTFSKNEWSGGTVYNPESGDTYDCKIWLKNNNTLKGRGYFGILYSTQEWTRVH